MKYILFSISTFIIFTLTVNAQKSITIEDIWSKYAFYAQSAGGFNVMKDGLHYTDLEPEGNFNNIVKYDLKSGKKITVIVKGADVKVGDKTIDVSGYSFSPDESKLLFSVDAEGIYRRSSTENNYVYDLKTGKTSELSTNGKQMFATFSPNGNKVAFVRGNNLFIKDLISGEEKQITTDGKYNEIKNGWADWVYEEEFSKANYFEWNSDGSKLAYVRFDERHVKEYTFDTYTNELYPKQVTFKYPKAGEDNSVLSVHIFDLNSSKTVNVDIGTEKDIYIPRIKWTNDKNILSLQRMNRLQNNLELLFADSQTGTTKIILTESSKTYIDITDDLTFLPNNKGFIWSSEADNFNHLYYYDNSGKLINQITKGQYDVVQFNGYDEKNLTLYYTTTENGQINRDVYSIKLNGTSKKRLSTAEGTTNADFSRGLKYYVSSYSNANTPPVYELHSSDGKLIKVLEDNADLKKRMSEYNLSKKEFFKFKNTDGVELNGWMMKPQNFDPNKKYPVYMFAYNGPGSNECNNAWETFDFWWHSLLNQEGYMVVCVDGRGTFGRGREFKHCTYLQLGKLETLDQIDVAKYLGTLSYVDKDRIGFQGWSFGGYLASLLITKGADYFKSCIAVAPVTNWKWYDNIYTERFLRKPKDNVSGYEDNSPVNFTKNVKGKFLLVHGSSDDNVHFQNSMELANALVKNNKPFDFMVYPNKNHGIYGGYTRTHLYTKMLKFVKENL
jgi:dipeptidyl-peptidase-4